jgi:diacylglycerol kinase (ATP)
VRSYTFLVNPTSGGGAAPAAAAAVARGLEAAGATVQVIHTSSAEVVPSIVTDAVGRGDVVVSTGGDGMLSSIAGVVSAHGGILGIVPAGRGNDFARQLGLPGDPVELSQVLLSAAPRPVDLLSWQGARIVAGSVYAGVDARISEIVDRVRWMPAKLQYPYASVHGLATYRPNRYRVTIDGVSGEYDAATVVIANSGYYGKGMHIAPAAVVDDGFLDVIVIGAGSKVQLVRKMPKVYDGSHVDLDGVEVLRGQVVELHADGPVQVPVGGDGEPLGVLPGLGDAPATVTLLPGALRLIAGS